MYTQNLVYAVILKLSLMNIGLGDERILAHGEGWSIIPVSCFP